MKILILNWRDIRHPRAGGAEMRLHQIYAPLTQQGHEVVLYSCAFPGCAKTENVDGIEVRRLGNDLTFAPLCTLNLKRWAKKHRADIVVEELNKLPIQVKKFDIQNQNKMVRFIFEEQIEERKKGLL